MKLFLDTSSLFKLYHQEIDSNLIEGIFAAHTVRTIFLSDLTKVEFASTVWKKLRTRDITELQATTLLESFKYDFDKYTFIQIDNIIIEQAQDLLKKHGSKGLRALDSIQLSTAVMLKSQVDLFISADNLLNFFLEHESLQTRQPGS
jgi:predicted nucleic acid-binding protein